MKDNYYGNKHNLNYGFRSLSDVYENSVVCNSILDNNIRPCAKISHKENTVIVKMYLSTRSSEISTCLDSKVIQYNLKFPDVKKDWELQG